MPELYVGLMSGTSLDGIDGVLVDCAGPGLRVLASDHARFEPTLRTQLLALQEPAAGELANACLAANLLSDAYARCVRRVLAAAGVSSGDVRAIGCHGQTVRHRPGDGYTVQLVNGARLAELAAAPVVCDFRSRDIAAGGEGAPLVPAFHRAVFHDPMRDRVVVNIGGIANVTFLPASGEVTGFDCGPGNALLDGWIERHRGLQYDDGGRWAAGGSVIAPLLERLLAQPFFARTPPKSTGRELVNLAWPESVLSGGEAAQDVQATLLELTAVAIARAIIDHCATAREVFLCGGGARNTRLVERIAARVSPRTVATTEALGIAPEWVEASAFAWLARQTVLGQPGNVPAVTGARGPRVLGAIYPA
jgi:anhydro-N-acetylmuramic acid kinase